MKILGFTKREWKMFPIKTVIFGLILLISPWILAGCEDNASIIPEDINHAVDACTNHQGWAYFKKDAMYRSIDKKVDITVYCDDSTIIHFYPSK